MPEPIELRILSYLKSGGAKPLRPRSLAKVLQVQEEQYPAFRTALKQLMHEGRVALGSRGAIVLPTQKARPNLIVGTYRQHRRGFGFVIPRDPATHEDLFIPEGLNGGAISGDVVSAQIVSHGQRDGKSLYEGKIVEVVERTHTRFAGTLVKQHNQWLVLPDGNVLTEPILTPDAASRHIKVGTKVIVELTTHPQNGQFAQGVITEALGKSGEKDVDLKSVITQFDLPGSFPEEVVAQARRAIDRFNTAPDWSDRIDLTDEVICTIDPDDAKDYDDAISLRRRDDGRWELGVHIADVAYFLPQGTPLDMEAYDRGNSVYFPGHVIPMLPEILSNGVCSLQENLPRLCKSAFIAFDEHAKPSSVRFANTLIRSTARLRYREAQAIIDRAHEVPHPDGPRKVSDYDPRVVSLLDAMNVLAKRIQKRRHAQGQIVLDLPEINLVLDEEGKVIGTEPEDQSYTHTLIEMFMVEANEAVARLLDSQDVPFIRRVHPGPEVDSAERLRHFVQVAGYRLPKVIDHKAIQSLLAAVKGKPESHAINLAVLKSLSRAEYSPEAIGHYALASDNYCHFTSPIRRYADLLIHRLLDQYIRARDAQLATSRTKKKKIKLEDVPSYDKLVEMGRHMSITERRADEAENELRQVKVLELLTGQIGEEFFGVVTGITNFGVFIQLRDYLIDGLIRYEDLMDDWWDVDERSGIVRGQRTGKRIGIGEVVKVVVVKVDVPRRELTLAISQLLGRDGKTPPAPEKKSKKKQEYGRQKMPARQQADRRRGRRGRHR
ncbi:MAG TPA: ribonuclease R, partial [Tepidisphaeraceae bacterium]|nr:ribonuclease R [Tepidisphaeraceae bacterium]